jgi:hypothetical protein
MAPPRNGGFRQRFKDAAAAGYRQASGRGVSLPTPTGLALAPMQGIANFVGLGGVFQSLQQQTATWYENTRQFRSDASRFRALLIRDGRAVSGTTQRADRLLRTSLGRASQGQRKTLRGMLTTDQSQYDSRVFGRDISEGRVIDKLGFSTGDIRRLAIGAAQSGLEGTGRDFKSLALLSGAVERGMNISSESQAGFFSAFGRNAGGLIEKGFSPAQQAAKDLKGILGQSTSTSGAGLMNADVPAYLQEMTNMMRSQARQGIMLAAGSVLDLGQAARNESSQRQLFQGFAGLSTGQAVIDAARGAGFGQGSGLDQAMMFQQAVKKTGGRSMFDTMLMLEEGGSGGKEFASMFEGYLEELRSTVDSDEDRKGLAVMLQQGGGLFGGMGLSQILSLLEGGRDVDAPALTDKDILRRGQRIVDPTQKRLARVDRAEVQHMQKRMNTRTKIMEIESATARRMGDALASLELKSVEMVESALKNVSRFGNISKVLSRKTSGIVDTMNKFGDALGVLTDIIGDTARGESSLTPAEKALKSKRKNRKKP